MQRKGASNQFKKAPADCMRAYGQSGTAIANAMNVYGFRTLRCKELKTVEVQRVVALYLQ